MAVNRVSEFTQNARTQLLALQQQVDEIFSGQIRDRSTLIQVKEQLESFTEQIQARLNQRTATGALGRELNQMVAQGRQLFRTVEAYTRKVAGELQGERNRTGTDTVALRQAVAARATGAVHETGDAVARRAVARSRGRAVAKRPRKSVGASCAGVRGGRLGPASVRGGP